MPTQKPATSSLADEQVPALEPGLTVLELPQPRSTALHQVALHAMGDRAGPAYWVDARNTASTYALHELAPDDRDLERIHIARAFTAYQHVSLLERVLNTVSPRTGLIVVPNAASLYRDDDVPAYEAEALLEIAIETLVDVATTFEIPVLATDAGPDDDLGAVLAAHATAAIEYEETQFGYRFAGDSVESTVYWQDGAWQTTIPYWIDLLGTAVAQPTIDPVEAPMRVRVEG